MTPSTKVYTGVRFDVYRTESKKEFIAHPGAVVIVPMLKDKLILIRNERFAVGETLWELPAGTLEPGEKPETTALRELIEETGYRAKSIEHLTTFFTSPGISNEKMYAYAATDLEEVGQNLDVGEKITVEILTWDKVMRMIKEGEIRDGKTIASLLYFACYKKKE